MSTLSYPMQPTAAEYNQTQPTTVYDQLVTAAKQSGDFQDRRSNERNQDYLNRLVIAVSKVPDEVWSALPPDAQTWFNLAAAAINAVQPIPTCPGYTPAPEVESAGPIKRQKITPQKEAQPRITARIRAMALLNPSWNVKKIVEELEKEGWTEISKGTVVVQTHAVHTVVRDAETLGFQLVPPAPDQSGNGAQ